MFHRYPISSHMLDRFRLTDILSRRPLALCLAPRMLAHEAIHERKARLSTTISLLYEVTVQNPASTTVMGACYGPLVISP